MKRLLALVMVLALTVSMVSAGLLSLGLGGYALNDSYTGGSGSGGDLSDFGAYRIGAEVRAGVLFAEASVSALYNNQASAEAIFEGLATIGLDINIFNILHFGLGVGPYFGIGETSQGLALFYGDVGDLSPASNLQEILDGSTLYFRAHGDFQLGRLSVGVTYQVPTNGYVLGGNPLAILPVWESARYGATAMFWLF
jgi:hypothetical protein